MELWSGKLLCINIKCKLGWFLFYYFLGAGVGINLSIRCMLGKC